MLDKELTIAIKAALEAGEAIMKIYNTKFNVEYKSDKSPITLADKRANEIINSYLKETKIPIISEESRQIDYVERKLWSSCWLVDPVDGTKEFIKRNGEFTVNIALIKKGKPSLGVIYAPALKTLYAADVSLKNAFKAKLNDHITPIETVLKHSKIIGFTNKIGTKLNVITSRSNLNKETQEFIKNLNQTDKDIQITTKGSSLKFCLIAEGKADIYPRFAPTMEWDTAAGHAICNAVGIKVLSKESKNELIYNKESLYNPYFLVSK